MRKCVECSAGYDPNESYYPDICDPCAAIMEGMELSELYGTEENQ